MTRPSGFRLLVVGIDDYKHWGQIPASDSAAGIEVTLAPFGLEHTERALDSDGGVSAVTTPDVGAALRKWFHPSEDDPPEAHDPGVVNSILYWGGHGEFDAGRLWLMTSESPRSDFDTDRAIEVGRIGRALQLQDRRWESEPGWTLVVLDCCQGGTGIQNLINDFTAGNDHPPRAVGFLSASDDSATFSGELPRAVALVLDSYTGTDDEIPLWDLVRRVADEVGSRPALDRLPSDAVLANPGFLGGPLTAVVESLVALEKVLREAEPEVVSHFLNKAQGTELDDRAWYFEGRDDETREVVRWLGEADRGMYVVTGDAGAGKSAFLGRLVIFGEPVMLDALIRAGILDERPPADLLPVGGFDAVIHLTAKSYRDTLDRVVDVISKVVGRPIESDIEQILDALREHDGRVSILVDALDEALDPFIIAASLLRRLAAVDGVRVVVGTRRSLNEGPDQEVDRDDVGLINALGFAYDPATQTFTGPAGSVHPLQPEPDAIERYVQRRLTIADHSPYNTQRAAAIARRVKEADQPFLFARLATTELLGQAALSDEDLTTLLAGDHQGIFRAALGRFEAIDEHTVPLLRALAYSLGRGFPQREGIWRSVTEDLHPGLRVRERDIKNTLDLAAAYIVHDGEFGQATYRLAHRTFAAHFFAEQ